MEGTLASTSCGLRGGNGEVSMADDAAQWRAERGDRAAFHIQAQRRRSQEESAKAQLLIDQFVARAKQAGLPTEELTARPYSGSGRYRTGIVGWYLRSTRSVGVDTDGSFYVLLVPPVRFGRWRTVRVDPSPPPLVVGKGAGDGEVFDLDVLLQKRLSGQG
jgi:hypothetical protein